MVEITFDEPLTPGRLLRRYKRFLADVELQTGEVVVAHCTCTGRMSGCADVGSRVWLERAPPRSRRKLAWTWVLTSLPGGGYVGVHTGYPSRLVGAALRAQALEPVAGYRTVRREVRVGRSRLDLHCQDHPRQPPAWVEVKTVTLVTDAVALFPDAVTTRGRKHLEVLSERVRAGERAAMVYVVQRPDARSVRPADEIDPQYGAALRAAVRLGVEAYAVRVDADPLRLRLAEMLPVEVGL